MQPYPCLRLLLAAAVVAAGAASAASTTSADLRVDDSVDGGTTWRPLWTAPSRAAELRVALRGRELTALTAEPWYFLRASVGPRVARVAIEACRVLRPGYAHNVTVWKADGGGVAGLAIEDLGEECGPVANGEQHNFTMRVEVRPQERAEDPVVFGQRAQEAMRDNPKSGEAPSGPGGKKARQLTPAETLRDKLKRGAMYLVLAMAAQYVLKTFAPPAPAPAAGRAGGPTRAQGVPLAR